MSNILCLGFENLDLEMMVTGVQTVLIIDKGMNTRMRMIRPVIWSLLSSADISPNPQTTTSASEIVNLLKMPLAQIA